MIEDTFVIDAIAHCLDYSDENCIPGLGEPMQEMICKSHPSWNAPGQTVPREVLLMQMEPETMARTLFLESPVDFAVTHHLPTYSWMRDGLTTREQNEELVNRWPHRFAGYAGVDPTAGIDHAIRQLDEQMESCPGLIGVKLYPAAVNPLRSFRIDDEEIFPLFEHMRKLGLKIVGIHKALPLGPMPLRPFEVGDVDTAAHLFPDLDFEIVHAGMAFVEETAMALSRMPNVYANLEVTTGWLSAPHGPKGKFYDAIGSFLLWGGVEKLFFSTTAMVLHPRRVVESVWNLELPEEILERYGLDPLTAADKAALLGGSYARMAGLDIDELKAKIADDEFTQELESRMEASGDYVNPWDAWRAQAKRDGVLAAA